MNRKVPVWITICIALITASLVMIGTLKFAERSYKKLVAADDDSILSKVRTLDEAVRNDYYGETDATKITDSLMSGYIKALDDRYAAYYSADETQRISDNQEGRSDGLGISYTVDESGAILVVLVHSGSAADGAGIRRGDRITEVDGTVITADNLGDLVGKFKQEPGTKVDMTVVKSDLTEQSVEITLSEYTNQSVFAEMTADGIGYILLTTFDEQSPEQMKFAMEELNGTEGLAGIIFDVRGNAGGRVDALAKILDELLPEGELITANYKDGSSSTMYSSDEAHLLTVPAAILVDGGTASCAEIFASAMRDLGGCKLYGEKTFGKGIIQTTYKMQDGTSFKFTTSMATTKSGTVFNEVGLVPDVETAAELLEASENIYVTAADDPVVKAAAAGLAGDAQQTAAEAGNDTAP